VATATAVVVTGEVVSITVDDGGVNYDEVPNVIINGDGTGATATAVLIGGVVTSIIVDIGGSGYTAATVEITPPDIFAPFFEPSSLSDPETGPFPPIVAAGFVFDPGFDMQGWDGDIEIERDRVWITTFSGDPAKPPVAFRIFQDVQGIEEHTRIADRSKTIVNVDFNFGDTTLELVPNPEIPVPSLPTSILAIPTPQTPGVIWIEGERIEYRDLETVFDIDGRPTFTLSQLRRGTLGTSSGRPINYLREPIIADGITREFDLSAELVAKENLLVVDYTKIYDTPLNAETPLSDRVPEIAPDESFTIFTDFEASPPQDRIRFVSAPVESVDGATFMVLGFDDFTTFLNATVQYPEGTIVINGSQKLPGGYSFDSSGAGIQFSNKPFAKFLVAGPGTRDK